ncbi:MAG: TIGR01212 family radical SAM protein [Candidatus Epulonipiscioides saccharophilum]|nr:MAG: TIGR01212 family radical SAM protein [Epulopiscium sp. AS2M-Bin001]
MSYNRYSDFLKNKFGQKVYKVTLNQALTCPNRDGNCGEGGCTYCGEKGVGFETEDEKLSLKMQLENNINVISKKYNAKKFIAYFQNYSNTYTSLENFSRMLQQIEDPRIVAVSISTRPDCINDQYLAILKDFETKTGYSVCVELGLQTVNYHTLKKINRGHSLAEFIDAVLKIQRYGFETVVHLILNLPWDNMDDVIECAKIISALNLTYVKLHALYLVKNTIMAEQFLNGEFKLISVEEYKKRVITFLRYLKEDIVIQRIIGRVPEDYAVFANWGISWWKIHDEIIEEMEVNNFKQGDLCDYLNGKALKNKVFE